ncbi:hypothetical protein [Flavobacterium columnare]|uniref:hypothetical protein n=1 Tax=Flavobacterium columnare TaxID=996 RepID=UPI003C2F3DEB
MTTREIQIPNPFSFEFKTDEILQKIDFQSINKENQDFINFSIECNNIYVKSVDKILSVFSTFSNKQEILDFIYNSINGIHLKAYSDIFKQPLEGETLSVNTESLAFIKYNNNENIEIYAKDILERGGDILNILIFIVENYLESRQVVKKCLPEEEKNFYVIWYFASNIYSFRSFYEILSEERGSILIEEEFNRTKITISEEFKKIKTFITTSDIRDRNHINEYRTFTHKHNKNFNFIKNNILDLEIVEGNICNIKFKKSNEKGENEALDFSRYLKTDKYVENIILSYFDNLKLIDIYQIIVYVERIINHQIRKHLNTENYSLAYKIKKQELIDALFYLSSIEKDTIAKVVDAITEKDKTPYFWRKPLFCFEDTIYLSFSLLSSPNVDLLLESIFEYVNVKIEDQIVYFKNELIEGLNIDNGYKFDLIESHEKGFENNIIYELRDYLLLIEVVLLEKMPIESSEIAFSLDYINEHIERIPEKIEFLKKSNDTKSVLPIVIINYSLFSGMLFNGVSIFDKRLLKNYFVTGEFQRARINYNSKNKNAFIYNKFRYYENEDEFNDVFINFQYNPLPVVEIINKLYWKEVPVFPNSDLMQLHIDVCDYVDENENIGTKIHQLNSVLKQQYYNSYDENENRKIDKAIQYYLTDIFNLLAHGKYDFSLNRFEVSKSFQKINIRGFAHLIHYFTNTLNELGGIKIKSTKTFNPVKFESDNVLKLIDKLIGDKSLIRISEFKSDSIFTKTEEKQIITFNLRVLSSVTITRYSPEDFQNFLLSLSIIKSFKEKYSLHFEFYSAVNNIISALNFNNHYQTARNLSEEILLISIQEKKVYRGWGILFLCSEQQKNIFDASVYGCLYITSLSIEENLTYSEIVEVFFNILKFSRNIYSSHLIKSVFNFLKSIKLKDYDDQKIHLSYYLSAFLNTNIKNRDSLIEDSFTYFEKNTNKIIKYKEKGVLPWLNYFYNIKRLINDGFVNIKFDVDKFVELLESKVNQEYFSPIKEKHFSDENLKNNFIEAIKKSLNTISFSDYTFENQNFELDMHNLTKQGIKNNDFESILLSGLIANDIRLIYKNSYFEKNTVVPLMQDNNDLSFVDNYLEFIKSKIKIKKNQLYVYLFESNKEVYYLLTNSGGDFLIRKSKNWNIDKMNMWLKNKENFYFNSKNYFDISEQEIAYDKLLDDLSYTDLELNSEYDEILISTSLDLINYPINLIIDNGDFLGSKCKLTNVILLEWFIENSEEFIIKNDFTATCWVPLEAADPAISYGYEKLKPVLEVNNIKTITSVDLESIDSNINIFFAHGELNGSSFKAIYESQENYSAIISNKALFGIGDVAILFVCHSGKMDKNFFSNSVISLVHEIIELGYKSVIAPCWGLEVTIPEFWFDEFIKKFKTGVYISEAVFYANNELAKYKESNSNAYYVAEGRLAMHLYGNPNIKIDIA